MQRFAAAVQFFFFWGNGAIQPWYKRKSLYKIPILTCIVFVDKFEKYMDVRYTTSIGE